MKKYILADIFIIFPHGIQEDPRCLPPRHFPETGDTDDGSSIASGTV
jgi:hypothetical protein